MSRPPDGIAGLVADAVASAAGENPEPDLFDQEGAAEATTPLANLPAVRQRGQRGPGKRSLQVREFYLARFKHPLIALGELASAPVDELAAFLSCKRVDALDLQRKVMADVLAYIEPKAPTAIKVDGPLPVFMMGAVPAGASPAEQGKVIDATYTLLDGYLEQLQELRQKEAAAEIAASHDAASHGEDKT